MVYIHHLPLDHVGETRGVPTLLFRKAGVFKGSLVATKVPRRRFVALSLGTLCFFVLMCRPTPRNVGGLAYMRLNVSSPTFAVGCLCLRTVLFDDDIYLKGRGYEATMEARKWLETNEDLTQVRQFS